MTRRASGRATPIPVALVIGLLVACTGGTTTTAGPASPLATTATGSPAPTSAASEPASGVATVPLADVASLALDLDGGPDFPTELEGSVWILAPDGDEPAVVRIDPHTGIELGRLTAGGRLCQGLGAGMGSLWVCGTDGAQRIDPSTASVSATIPFAVPQGFARPVNAAGAMWMLSGNVVADAVVRIDPTTNTVASTIATGYPLTAIAGGAGAVWAIGQADGLLLRIDPDTGAVTTALADLPAPVAVAATSDSVWVVLYGPTGTAPQPGEPALLRYDPANGATERIDIGSSPGGSADLVATDDGIWVRGSDPFIVRVDPKTEVVTWAVSQLGTGDGALGLAAGWLWATSIDRGSVWRLER